MVKRLPTMWETQVPFLGSGRSPEGNGNPLQYSCLENPMDWKNLESYSPWGHKESVTIKRLTLSSQMLKTVPAQIFVQ